MTRSKRPFRAASRGFVDRVCFFSSLPGHYSLEFQGVLTFIIVLGVCAGAVVIVAALSRHKKSGAGDVQLIGLTAVVETRLDPEGTVLVRGELWRASSNDGSVIAPKYKVRIIGTRDHLLVVEPYG
jgi:membrane-bound serine protease (ClpP class)